MLIHKHDLNTFIRVLKRFKKDLESHSETIENAGKNHDDYKRRYERLMADQRDTRQLHRSRVNSRGDCERARKRLRDCYFSEEMEKLTDNFKDGTLHDLLEKFKHIEEHMEYEEDSILHTLRSLTLQKIHGAVEKWEPKSELITLRKLLDSLIKEFEFIISTSNYLAKRAYHHPEANHYNFQMILSHINSIIAACRKLIKDSASAAVWLNHFKDELVEQHEFLEEGDEELTEIERNFRSWIHESVGK